eukprot:5313417-Prymnesium_polylepis.1
MSKSRNSRASSGAPSGAACAFVQRIQSLTDSLVSMGNPTSSANCRKRAAESSSFVGLRGSYTAS